MATAVLDIGKTNVKLVVLDDAGRTLWSRRQANRPLRRPPYPHHDVEAIWGFASESLAEAAGAHRIDDIVTTTHGATGVLLGDAGLVLPVLDYEHPAPRDEAPGYETVRPAFAETLSPDLPGGLNLGRQLFWQSRRFPEAFARTRWILTYPQYWAWRLSGALASETTSLGCHTDLWRPRERDFSSLVDGLGWRGLFPPVRPAHAELGPVQPDLAAELGLPADCRVVSGIHDSNASLAPHLVTRRSPFTVVSTGTWVIVMGVGASATTLDERRDTLANVNVNGDPVICARFMGGRDHEILSPAGSPEPAVEDLQAVIASGALALPGFSGASGPFPNGPGVVEGALPPGPAMRAALAALYLALMTDHCIDLIGAGGDIVIEGAFAGNAAYASLIAGLRPGRTVLVSRDATGTSQGAAMLARWGGPHAAPASAPVGPCNVPGLSAYRAAWLARIGGLSAAGPAA